MYYRWGRFVGAPSEFWNDIDKAAVTLSNYQLTMTANGVDGFSVGLENMSVNSGKWYFELDIESMHSTSSLFFGFRQSFDGFPVGVQGDGVQIYVLGIYTDICGYKQASPYVYQSGTVVADATNAVGFTQGDRLMFAMDYDNHKIWVGVNGTWMNSGDPAAGTNPQWHTLASWDWRFYVNQGSGASVDNPTNPVVINLCTGSSLFPQDYSPPSGFNPVLPLSSADYYAGFNMYDRDLNNLWKHNANSLNEDNWRSNGTLFIGDASGAQGVGVMHSPEKYYWEMQVQSALIGAVTFGIGTKGGSASVIKCTMDSSGTLDATAGQGIVTNGSGVSFTNGDEIQFAMDLSDTGNIKLWIRKNGGSWLNSGDPAAGTNPTFEEIPVATYGWCIRAEVDSSVQVGLLANASFTHAAPSGFRTGIPVAIRGDDRTLAP